MSFNEITTKAPVVNIQVKALNEDSSQLAYTFFAIHLRFLMLWLIVKMTHVLKRTCDGSSRLHKSSGFS